MISFNELLQLDDSTILSGADSNGKPYLPQMLRLYSLTFGEVCGGCSSKFPEYLRKLRNQKKISMKTEKKEVEKLFQLKPGTLIPIIGTSDAYSDKNITDEASIRILKNNPNAIVLFKTYPKNWKEVLEASAEVEDPRKKELNAKTKAELSELYPEIKGTKAEMVDAILELEASAEVEDPADGVEDKEE